MGGGARGGLHQLGLAVLLAAAGHGHPPPFQFSRESPRELDPLRPDRKSTRLNSSHSQISYAVFCLKKKKKKENKTQLKKPTTITTTIPQKNYNTNIYNITPNSYHT